jgi:hypothetical protein
MREVSFTYPQTDFQAWTKACLEEIERASREDALTIADDYTITPGYTISEGGLRAAARDRREHVLPRPRPLLRTFMADIKKRGTKRAR